MIKTFSEEEVAVILTPRGEDPRRHRNIKLDSYSGCVASAARRRTADIVARLIRYSLRYNWYLTLRKPTDTSLLSFMGGFYS